MHFIFSKTLRLLILFLSFTTLTFAQNSSKITGNILDSREPVQFATISLSKLPDSNKVAYFTISDTLGKFSFDPVNSGDYIFKITSVGYQTLVKSIKVNENSVLNLKDLHMNTDKNVLSELVVTGQKRLIEKTSDGFVVNAAANISQIGGTATDLLKSTPTIAVDGDGGITLRGKAPLILINGRNSKLTNMDQIPASSIESIEVINNASAKYDANAQSGIINIKLKKNKDAGMNGAFAVGVGAGSRGRISSSALLNNKTDKWNVSLGYDNRFAGRTKNIKTNRTNLLLPDTYQINQNRNDERVERNQNLRFNVDFMPNSKNTISFEAIGASVQEDNNEDLRSTILTQENGFGSANDRHSWEYRRENVGEFALNYNRTFDNSKKSLNATINTSIEKARENTDIVTQNLTETNQNTGSQIFQRTHNYENSSVSNGILDYAFPIGTKSLFETGYKGTFRHITNDYAAYNQTDGVYVVNPASTNIFTFNEQINALYGLFHSYSGTEDKQKWKYELGLRMENVHNDGKTSTGSTTIENNYLKFFPTANISYIVGANEYWKLSYGKRINRPDLDEFNPFVDITDILNPHTGNPKLQPEIIHALELGYNKEWENVTLTSNAFFRNSQNTIRSFLQELGNGVVLRMPMNIGNSQSYGLENIFTAKVSNFYNLNASLTLYEQKYNAGNLTSVEAIQNSFNWFGKLINNMTIGKGGKLQVIGNYNSAATTPQGRTIPIYNVDLGYQQKLGKGNARLGLVVVDVFNTLRSGDNIINSEFINSKRQKADTRAFMLTFAYTFKSTFKEKLMENKFSKEF